MTKKTKIYHFPVGNGDMTLLIIATGNKFIRILCDMHIRESSNRKLIGFDETQCDVIAKLHEQLEKDGDDRPFIDLLILTHPDEDHIRGFEKYFHTGTPLDYKSPKDDDYGKIFVREIWSSPIIFKRKQTGHSLCDDAKAFNKEAKRRVGLYRDSNLIGEEGNRIRLIGKDLDGKTDDIMNIVYKRDAVIYTINETYIPELQITVLAPLDDEDFPEDMDIDKNRSSIVMQWAIASHGCISPTNYLLLAGDADVHVWEILLEKYQYLMTKLHYDLLIAPHHCSWHALSHDSFKNTKNPKVSRDAVKALSEARDGAVIIASSNKIVNDKNDPPNHQAMKEYKTILSPVDGEFKCLSTYKPNGKKYPEVLVYRLTNEGIQEEEGSEKSNAKNNAICMASTTRVQIPHG